MPMIPGGFGAGLILGAGALILAPLILPHAKRYLRSAAKSVIKGELIASDLTKTAVEKAKGEVETILEKAEKGQEEAPAETRTAGEVTPAEPLAPEPEATVAPVKSRAPRKPRKKAPARPRLKDTLSH